MAVALNTKLDVTITFA